MATNIKLGMVITKSQCLKKVKIKKCEIVRVCVCVNVYRGRLYCINIFLK